MKKPLDKVQIFGWVFLMLGIVMGSFVHYLDLDKKVAPHSFADYFTAFCMIALLGLGVGLLIYRFIISGAIHSYRIRALSSKGIKTTAMIKEIELGGKMDGLGNEYHPAVTLHVLVNSPTGGRHYARIDTIIAITHLPAFQPGAEIDVAYDPAEPTTAMLLTQSR